MTLIPLASIDDVPENGSLAISVDDHNLLVVRSAAGLFAIENMCSHAYQRLEGGKVRGPHIFCPMHGIRFDMRDGCPSGKLTDKPIKVWHAELVDGQVMVDFTQRRDNGA